MSNIPQLSYDSLRFYRHSGRVPAGAMINGTWQTVANANFICRSDTGAVISPSSLSDQYQPVQPAIGRHDRLPDLEAVAADRHGPYLGWCQIIINLPHPPGSRLDFRGTEGLNVHGQTDAASE